MTSRAILIGNATYRNQPNLACCHADVIAVRELLEATGKYEDVDVVEDADADHLKERIRTFVGRGQATEEIFLYYTGHGFQHDDEFFFCATNFDTNRPNETGLSTSELHGLLRLANAELVVKVIDACHSGALLVKVADALGRQSKDGFKHLVQFASCLDSQVSMTGDPLSVFTEKFIAASLRKTEGTVYYTDIINTLRDDSIHEQSQIPHFIAQGTGREFLVESARQFDALRARRAPPPAPQVLVASAPAQTKPLTLVERLTEADERLASPERTKTFVGGFFDALKTKLEMKEFADLFDIELVEHEDFREATTRGFIIRVLSKESRPDNFVTAEITQERKRLQPWSSRYTLNALMGYADDEVVEIYDLHLNCKMERVQLKLTLTPKFKTLKKIQLVITCAPSLETCYVFELGTLHALRDFGSYDTTGGEIVRRWYRFHWRDSTESVVTKIATSLKESVRAHVDAATKKLDAQDGA